MAGRGDKTLTFFTDSISKFCLPGLLFIRLNNQTKKNLKMHLIRRRSLLQGIRPPLNQPQPLWRRRRGMNLVLGQLRAGMRDDEVWGPARARPANAHARRGSPRTGKHGPLVCTRASGPRARCRSGGLRGKCAIGERSFWRRSCSGDSAMKHPGLAKSGDTFFICITISSFHFSFSSFP